MRTQVVRAGGLLAAVLCVVGCATTSAQPVVRAPVGSGTAKLGPADGQAYLGVSVTGSSMAAFRRAAGLEGYSAVWNIYINGDEGRGFSEALHTVATAPGTIPMISWTVGMTHNAVLNGNHDA